MPTLHIAGFPVEELLGVALVSAVPMLAFVSVEIADRVKRLRRGVRSRLSRDSAAEAGLERGDESGT